MTRPPGKINSATIFAKKAINIIIVPTMRRKRTMTTISPSIGKKGKTVLKICPNI